MKPTDTSEKALEQRIVPHLAGISEHPVRPRTRRWRRRRCMLRAAMCRALKHNAAAYALY